MSGAAADAQARFDRVVDRWFRGRLERDPALATSIGRHEHDAELPSGDRDAVDDELAALRSTVRDAETFDAGDLGTDRALDRDLLLHAARLRLWALEHGRAWARAGRGAERIGEALFVLFARDFAPLPERLAAIAARLEAAPAYLAALAARIDDPVALWLKIDLESLERLPSFLDTIASAARAERVDETLARRVERAVAGARSAMDVHAEELRRRLAEANDDWALGPAAFEELLSLRELGAGGDEILDVGESLLARESAAREAVAREIDPTLDVEGVAALIKEDAPASFAEALELYREGVERARRYVVDHELLTMPPRDRLRVVETPSFLRHLIPFAAYYSPARFDADPVGIYIVTPPGPGQQLQSRPSLSNEIVHEAYPGHHLQHAAALEQPSLVRALDGSPEYTEGWGFYCEEMMKEAGFDAEPAHRYVQLTDAIWRAARIVLDVRLHRRQIGFEEAVDFLVAATGFDRASAVAEVKRYTAHPTYQLSYLYGREMLFRLRDDVRRRMGPAFNLRFFHDTLLYGGTMPLSYARRLFDARLSADRPDR